MSDQQSTLAGVFLHLGGDTIKTAGSAFTAIGVLFGINMISGHSISLVRTLPSYLGFDKKSDSKTDSKTDGDAKKTSEQAVITRGQLYEASYNYFKIVVVILGGILLKKGGTMLADSNTLGAFNKFLYGINK